MKEGVENTYKFPEMSDEEVRSYYKKELNKKNWEFEKKDSNGSDIYLKSVYKNGSIYKYSFTVQRAKNIKQKEYEWILKIYIE